MLAASATFGRLFSARCLFRVIRRPGFFKGLSRFRFGIGDRIDESNNCDETMPLEHRRLFRHLRPIVQNEESGETDVVSYFAFDRRRV